MNFSDIHMKFLSKTLGKGQRSLDVAEASRSPENRVYSAYIPENLSERERTEQNAFAFV